MAAARVAAARNSDRLIAQLLGATANPDGRGLLVRGREHQPILRDELDPAVVESLLRLARLADWVATDLRDHPDPLVRRSAAVLAARAHPLRAGLDD